MSEPSEFFRITVEVIPIAIEKKTEEEITNYRNATLGFSENVLGAVMKYVSKLPKSQPVPIKTNKHGLEILKNSVDKDIPKRFYDQFEYLVKEFASTFPNRNGI